MKKNLLLLCFFLLLSQMVMSQGLSAWHLSLAESNCLKICSNALSFSPGLTIAGGMQWSTAFNTELSFHAGNLLGYDFTLGLNTTYQLKIGAWHPAIGLYAAVAWGSVVFITESSTNYIMPEFPELATGILLKPLRFLMEYYCIAFCSLAVGTDLRLPFQLIILDLELLAISIRWEVPEHV